MNNLSPRNNTILLLTRAQPSLPYDSFNSTDNSVTLNANLADSMPTLTESNAALYNVVDL